MVAEWRNAVRWPSSARAVEPARSDRTQRPGIGAAGGHGAFAAATVVVSVSWCCIET